MKRSRLLSILLSIALVLSTFTFTVVEDTRETYAVQTIPSDFNENLIKDASKYLGLRYLLGGRNPSVLDAYEGTLDCSGFVQRVLLDMGVGNVPLATGGHSKGAQAGWGSYGWLYKIFYKQLSLTYNGVTFNANNGNMIYCDSVAEFDAAINNPSYNGNTIVVLRNATTMINLEPYMKTGMIVIMSDMTSNNVVTQAAHMMMVAETIEPDANTNAASSVAEKTVRYADQAAAELQSRFVTTSLYSGTNYIVKTCTLGFESSAYSAFVSTYGKRYAIYSNTPFTGHQDFYCVINHAQEGVRNASIPNDGVGSKVWYIEAALSPHSVCFSNKAACLGNTPVYALYFNSRQTEYNATMNVSKSKSGTSETNKNVTYAWSTSKEIISLVAEEGKNTSANKLTGNSFTYDELQNGYSTSNTGDGGIAGMPPVCFGKSKTRTVYLTELTENGSGRYYEVSLNGTESAWGGNTSVNSVKYYKTGNDTGIALKNEISNTGSYYQFAGTIVVDKYYDNYLGFELVETDKEGKANKGNVYIVVPDEAAAETYLNRRFTSLEDAKAALGNSEVAYMYIDENGKTSFSSNTGDKNSNKVYVLQVVCTEDRIPMEGYLEISFNCSTDEGSNIENAVKASQIVSVNKITTDDEGNKIITEYPAFTNSTNELSSISLSTIYAVGRFTDINYNSYYIDSVRYVYENGIITGLDAEKFAPQYELRRTMAVTILYRMAGSPEVEVTEKPFKDVETDSWYAVAAQWAKDNGIATGYASGEAAGNFGVKDSITRQAFMKMLYSFADYMGYDVTVKDENSYLNAEGWGEVADYAKTMVNWGYENGYIGNNSPLMAKNTINRAQTATIISRFLQADKKLKPEVDESEEETEEETKTEETESESETEESESETEESESETEESESEAEETESETETDPLETEIQDTEPEIIPPSETYTELDTAE